MVEVGAGVVGFGLWQEVELQRLDEVGLRVLKWVFVFCLWMMDRSYFCRVNELTEGYGASVSRAWHIWWYVHV